MKQSGSIRFPVHRSRVSAASLRLAGWRRPPVRNRLVNCAPAAEKGIWEKIDRRRRFPACTRPTVESRIARRRPRDLAPPLFKAVSGLEMDAEFT
jgi:hypothetical protein